MILIMTNDDDGGGCNSVYLTLIFAFKSLCPFAFDLSKFLTLLNMMTRRMKTMMMMLMMRRRGSRRRRKRKRRIMAPLTCVLEMMESIHWLAHRVLSVLLNWDFDDHHGWCSSRWSPLMLVFESSVWKNISSFQKLEKKHFQCRGKTCEGQKSRISQKLKIWFPPQYDHQHDSINKLHQKMLFSW